MMVCVLARPLNIQFAAYITPSSIRAVMSHRLDLSTKDRLTAIMMYQPVVWGAMGGGDTCQDYCLWYMTRTIISGRLQKLLPTFFL